MPHNRPGTHGADLSPESGDPLFPAYRARLATTLPGLDAGLTSCRACPRLVEWREQIATVKRSAFRQWDYWAKPVPGFGPSDAALAIIGLAPAAHGGNRTGRIFTGDPAGDALYAALHAIGLASQSIASYRGDGLQLRGVRITVPVHCAPPANKPTTTERDTCRLWLARELQLLRPTLRVVVALGAFGWSALLPVLADAGWRLPRPHPRFGHGAYVRLAETGSVPELHLLGCYHPSQRNISTRTLTPAMLRNVLRDAAQIAGL